MATAATALRAARRRSGLGLRELARRAGTSHATLRAYEQGDKDPRVDTIERIARAAGFALELDLATRPDPEGARAAKGEELFQALILAAAFPARHRPHLDAPVFGPRP
jgi:transcriptional regulator with XRE-family HTH domain